MMSSNRAFGVLLSTIIFFIAFLYKSTLGINLYLAFNSFGLILLVIAILAPSKFANLKYYWIAFGEAIGRVVSPIVLALIFFFLVTPIAFIMRLCGRDELHLKNKAGNGSYWLSRRQKQISPEYFKDQF